MNLLGNFRKLEPAPYSTTWRSPANIAFVKYWGKKGPQLPANPSLSMTLKECVTETRIQFSPAPDLEVDLFLSGRREDKFALKVKNYLANLESELPWIKRVAFTIETKNTFPHGAGIASSASGLSAIALCLTDYLHQLKGEDNQDLFFKRAGHLSRLASGSACRSVYGGFTTWGDTSDFYATPFEVHPEFATLNDAVLVISADEKSVSSRAGHERMQEHAFAEARFGQARSNYQRMCSALKTGDMDEVGLILENEALSLHAMMMTSPNAFTLLRPNSLAAMEMVKDFRRQTKLPLYYTLDAGPNLHLIYPQGLTKIETFIANELSPLAVRIIKDQTGCGPEKC